MSIKESVITPKTISFLIGGLVIGLVIGLVAMKTISLRQMSVKSTANPASTLSQIDDSFFNDQSALLNGKIKNVTGKKITVENWQKKTMTFTLNEPVFITDQSTTTKPASPSGDINKVPLDQFVIINLRKLSGEYKVVSVVITPPLSTPPPTAKSSAK